MLPGNMIPTYWEVFQVNQMLGGIGNRFGVAKQYYNGCEIGRANHK